MPVTSFRRAFKAATGRTPYQYVLKRRIAKARGMFTTTRLPLAEIACQWGFSSQSHMTDVFKTKLGASPGGLGRTLQ